MLEEGAMERLDRRRCFWSERLDRLAAYLEKLKMQSHRIVSREEWLSERKALLACEKALTKARDEVARQRRELPFVRVEKPYRFEGLKGEESLADLFEGRSQLIVYHFMFGPEWQEGCRGCSFLADHIDGAVPHLAHRDVTLTAVARAPLRRIEAFKARMGWRFKFVSSFGSDFNFDHGVSFTAGEIATTGEIAYNYKMQKGSDELPGISVFYKNERAEIFHSYSSYGRGGDLLIGTYNYLDLVPKGRDEDSFAFPMAWVRHHDRYGDGHAVDPKAGHMPPRKTSCCEGRGDS
jgi:predicted dithiol-disulfide oxidoreductase (DUF899 family)